LLNGLVCLVVGDLEFTVGPVSRIGLMMETAVSQRTTEALVEEQEQECDLHAFGGEPVGVSAAIAFEQTVTFEFAQIVAELVQLVSMGRKLERGEDGFMDLVGGPTADRVAAVQKNLQQPDDPRVMDFDAGIAHRTHGHGQGDPLQQWEVHVDVEALRLKTGEAIGDGLESLPHSIQLVESFLQAEVAQIIGAQLVAQEAGELLVLSE
jgi:hypothetical protein